MSRVLVVDQQQRPLSPCTPARARLLLKAGKAAVLRRFPFVLILRDARPEAVGEPLRLKLDPGSKTTGLAVVNDARGEVVWAAEVTHRGQRIREALAARRAVRRSRRQRKTRYRPQRFANRRRAVGWLAPSLLSRVLQVLTWVARLRRFAPIGAISVELARFDTQRLQDPTISDIEYQQGELAGFELREYLLIKWNHTCAYCSISGVPMQLDHLAPRSRGGSNRASNLVLSCASCNQRKGNQAVEEFLADRPGTLARVLAQVKIPLRDTAAITSTRWALYRHLQATGLPVEVGTGGRTKYQRMRAGLPKTHFFDAACVGASTPQRWRVRHVRPLLIQAMGWQCRQMKLMDKYGFPRTRAKQQSRVKGFRTGDLIRAVVPSGKKAGRYTGRVAVRASGSFNVTTGHGTIQGISHRHSHLLHQQDGYTYAKGGVALLPNS